MPFISKMQRMQAAPQQCSNKFGIVLGLHYRCLAAKVGCASTMLK